MSQIIKKVAYEDPVAAATQIEAMIDDTNGQLHKNGLTDSSNTEAHSWSKLEPEKATRWAANLPDEQTRKVAVESAVGN